MRLGKRLERVETSLTPKQAVLLDLKETLELGFLGFAKKALETPRHQGTRARIAQAVGSAVHESLSVEGMSSAVIAHAVREAEKQADFLLVLIRDLQKHVAFICELNAPYTVLLYEKFGSMREQKIQNSTFERRPWVLWRTLLIKKLSDVWRLRETINQISKRYYDGHPLLFSEDESTIKVQICCLEELAQSYNSLLRNKQACLVIDLEALWSSVRKQALREVRKRVAEAQSTTLEDFGEFEAASKVMEPYELSILEKLRTATEI